MITTPSDMCGNMFIIFGWGHRTTKHYGATLPMKFPGL